jgi:hypothetical protein
MMVSQPLTYPLVGDADSIAASHESLPLPKKALPTKDPSSLQCSSIATVPHGEIAKRKLSKGLPAETDVFRVLQKMRGKNGVAAKILAKRAPGGLQWKADHSTFSALNLESKNGALKQPAKSVLASQSQASKPTHVQGDSLKSGLKSVGSCSTDTTPDKNSSTDATLTDPSVDSLPSTGDSPENEDSATTFTEFRKLALECRSRVGPNVIPHELETLRSVEGGEQKRASLGMHPPSFARTVSVDSTSTQFSHDTHGASFSRQQSASALTMRWEPFSRSITGESLSSGFGPGFARAATDGMVFGGSPFMRSVTSESISEPFARARTVSCNPLDELRRSVQSLLNKVCPENISLIADKIARINVRNADELEVIIELIFRKALAEPHYCETYADLIFSLRSAFPEFPSDDGGKNITFKSSILNVCQNEFEALPRLSEKTEEDREKAVGDGTEESEIACKRRKDRMLANMKLIGHIFLRQLLPSRVISSVIQELVLGNGDEENHTPEEHSIECACELLMSTGHTLESMASGRQSVQLVCCRLSELKNLKTAEGKGLYSKRIQFLVQDMLDARLAGWTKKSFKSSAKTKEEVRLDQERELTAKMQGETSPAAEQVVAGQRPNYVTIGHNA